MKYLYDIGLRPRRSFAPLRQIWRGKIKASNRTVILYNDPYALPSWISTTSPETNLEFEVDLT